MNKPLEYYLDLQYPITIYPEITGGYSIAILDLPGCITCGETIEHALFMINDLKKLWLEVALENGDDIPLPNYSTRNEIELTEEQTKMIYSLVKCNYEYHSKPQLQEHLRMEGYDLDELQHNLEIQKQILELFEQTV